MLVLIFQKLENFSTFEGSDPMQRTEKHHSFWQRTTSLHFKFYGGGCRRRGRRCCVSVPITTKNTEMICRDRNAFGVFVSFFWRGILMRSHCISFYSIAWDEKGLVVLILLTLINTRINQDDSSLSFLLKSQNKMVQREKRKICCISFYEPEGNMNVCTDLMVIHHLIWRGTHILLLSKIHMTRHPE